MSLTKTKSAAELGNDDKYIKISYRQKGSESPGTVYKGESHWNHSLDVETVLYPQLLPQKKGFGSNTFRFGGNASEVPGPGAYIDPTKAAVSSLKQVSDSFSRKGYGNGFISQNDRFKIDNYHPYQVPGPGSYKCEQIPAGTSKELTGTAFSLGSISEKYKQKNSPEFASRVNKQEVFNSPQLKLPGPGAYNIPRNISESPDYRHTSPFKSQDDRFTKSKAGFIPGPGQYELDMEGIRRKLVGNPFGVAAEILTTANFKKPTGAKRIKVNLYDPFENIEKDGNKSPGPGQYSTENRSIMKESIEKGTSGTSSMFVIPEVTDRFGKPKIEVKDPAINMLPGPGQYFQTTNNEQEDEELRKGKDGKIVNFSAFKSEVKRISYLPDAHGPGPAFYKFKQKLTNETKNANPAKDWI